MKIFILLLLSFYVYSICNAQVHEDKGSIQIYYNTGKMGGAIGGQNHGITIWLKDSLIFLNRICYSTFNYKPKYIDTILSNINADLTCERYQEAQKQAILQYYQENDSYLVLDEHVEISKTQFDDLIKIINEIKAYVPEEKSDPDEILISTKRNHYVIKCKNGTTIILDWLGRYNKSRDIEKILGLKSYLRCPCVEEDLKQMNNRRKKSSN